MRRTKRRTYIEPEIDVCLLGGSEALEQAFELQELGEGDLGVAEHQGLIVFISLEPSADGGEDLERDFGMLVCERLILFEEEVSRNSDYSL